jgi:hypothetical protein
MRAAIPVALFVMLGFAGCVTTLDDEPKVFDRTCPVYHASPGSPKWRNTALIYNETSAPGSDLRENPQVDKWVVRPTVGGGFYYRDGTLDFIELELSIDYIVDGSLTFNAYRSSKDEPAAYNPDTMTDEEYMQHTGAALNIRDMNAPGNPILAALNFGPGGSTEEDIILDVTGKYRVEFTDGVGAFDPSNLRIDVTFVPDADGDPQTDSAAAFDLAASLWYRHNDCA